MMEKNIYVSNADPKFIFNHTVVDKIKDADIVVIGGNNNVSPELFDQTRLSSGGDAVRDIKNISLFSNALIEPKVKLIIGVNYGAILACAIAGGQLIQNVTNHASPSLREAKYGPRNYLLPSNHTQMMHPYNLNDEDYEVIIYSLEKSDRYAGPFAHIAENPEYKEPEYVLFKNLEKPILAMMPDISKMRINTRTVRMTNKLIDQYLENV